MFAISGATQPNKVAMLSEHEQEKVSVSPANYPHMFSLLSELRKVFARLANTSPTGSARQIYGSKLLQSA